MCLRVLTFSAHPQIWSFCAAVRARTAKKRSKMPSVRAGSAVPLFLSKSKCNIVLSAKILYDITPSPRMIK